MLEKKRVLGDYNIGKTIGQGAFSKVKIGFHIETNQKVAIKVIDKKQMEAKAKKAKEAHEQREKRARRNSKTPTDANGNSLPATEAEVVSKEPTPADTKGGSKGSNAEVPSLVSRLQQEVQLLMRLDHPNVIKLYQVVENEDECFVVMEYASGGELIEHIAAKGYLIEKEARKFFRQMTSALDHCHLANVVHRDLKLENLLLNSERNLLISDFGLGRTFQSDDNDLMKTFCGTPNYAAVELISGIPYTGVKSDIWAMGVVLYVMMTGRPPFVGENISQLYSKIKAVDYKCPDYFSADLVGLLKRMLVKDPKERASMDEIRQHPWVNFEEVELPLRVLPKVVGNPDLSKIGQFISGIHQDQGYITYTFRAHTFDANKTPAVAAKGRQRRGSRPPEPRPSAAGGSATSSRVLRRLSIQSHGDSAGGAPLSPGSITAPPTLNVPRGTLGRTRRNTVSTVESPKIVISCEEGSFAAKPAGQVGTQNHVNFGTGSRLGQSGSASSPMSMRKSRRATLSSADATSPTLQDRDFTIMRRMSQVGPSLMPTPLASVSFGSTNAVSGKERRDSNEAPRFQSMSRQRSTSLSPQDAAIMTKSNVGSGSTVSGPEDHDPMMISVEEYETIAEDEPATEITKNEIENWHSLHRPPKQIRSVRFAYNSTTTSSSPPSQIFMSVHQALVLIQKREPSNNLTFTRVPDLYMLNCEYAPVNADDRVEFEIEICKLWLLKLHGIRVKRLSGNPFVFKDLYHSLVDFMKL